MLGVGMGANSECFAVKSSYFLYLSCIRFRNNQCGLAEFSL